MIFLGVGFIMLFMTLLTIHMDMDSEAPKLEWIALVLIMSAIVGIAGINIYLGTVKIDIRDLKKFGYRLEKIREDTHESELKLIHEKNARTLQLLNMP